MLYRQARGQEPFAGEVAAMRGRMIEVVSSLLRGVVGGAARPVDVVSMAHALVGAGESLADWLADHVDEDPEATATRLMNVVWTGAGGLLRGETWRPAWD